MIGTGVKRRAGTARRSRWWRAVPALPCVALAGRRLQAGVAGRPAELPAAGPGRPVRRRDVGPVAGRRRRAPARRPLAGAAVRDRPLARAGLSSDSARTASIPFPVTAAVLRRGQERFEINCVACHGRSGEGNGIVVQRGFSKPPSYYCRELLNAPDATIYNAMANGYGAMYSFNDRLPPDDRWAVTAYVRALQQSATRAAPADRPASYGGPTR